MRISYTRTKAGSLCGYVHWVGEAFPAIKEATEREKEGWSCDAHRPGVCI